MAIQLLQTIIAFSLFLMAGLRGCDQAEFVDHPVDSPLADSLMVVFADASEAIREQRFADFLALVDPVQRQLLDPMVQKHGYSSLRVYLEDQMHGWPDPDTLMLSELTHENGYARLTFVGTGDRMGRRQPMIRYTFILLKQTLAGWRLTAMSTLEKPAFDQYGQQLGYHEIELPARLRFPKAN